MTFDLHLVNPHYLVETEWLAANLDDAELRVFDCTTYLDPHPVSTYTVRSGRDNWRVGHIPGSDFIDLQDELSDRSSPFRFTMPTPGQFAEAMSRHGLRNHHRVVLYCSDRVGWSTRLWWMLRCFGFDNAAVLNGGLDKWKSEGRPLSVEPSRYPPGHFVPSPRPDLIASKAQVVAATSDPRTCIINGLTPEQFTGESGMHYGRPGRIPNSVNIPARDLIDANKVFQSPARLISLFKDAGAAQAERIIAYCGGGIAASTDVFVLAMLGHEQIALYDGSLSEWAADRSLPMEAGPKPPARLSPR